MSYTSKLIEEAVNEISSLPGIGKKTALRLALFLLKKIPNILSGWFRHFIDYVPKYSIVSNAII